MQSPDPKGCGNFVEAGVKTGKGVQGCASLALGFVAGSRGSNNSGQDRKVPENTETGSAPVLENGSADERQDQFHGAALVQVDVTPRGVPRPDRRLSAREAAKILGVCPHSVYTLCETGKLTFVRAHNAIRIRQADVDRFMKLREELALAPTPSGATGHKQH